MASRSFRDLRVWQSAEDLTAAVYDAVKAFPAYEQFGLSSQLRRSVISVPSNIAEGFGRRSAEEKDQLDQFYHHALGSLYEADTQLGIARRLGYISEDVLSDIQSQLGECRAMLLKLIQVNKY